MTNIQVEHLTKRFGPLAAVDDLSFAVQEGRVTGFLGANGSGKTTTLRVLLGLSEATAGTATDEHVFPATAGAIELDVLREAAADLDVTFA